MKDVTRRNAASITRFYAALGILFAISACSASSVSASRELTSNAVHSIGYTYMTESDYAEYANLNGSSFGEDVRAFLAKCALPGFPDGTALDFGYDGGDPRYAFVRPGRRASFSDPTSFSFTFFTATTNFETYFYEIGDSSVSGVSQAQKLVRYVVRHFGKNPTSKLGGCPE